MAIKSSKNSNSGEFDEQIFKELIEKGLSGEELLKEFKKKQADIRPAVEKLITESNEAAAGKGKFYSYNELFGAEVK